MPSTTEITPKQLFRLIGGADAPAIVDVRIDADFDDDPHFAPTAFRWPHARIEALAPRLAGRRVVVICQKGLKLSQGAAAMLRAEGIAAETLQGGAFAWREEGLPTIRAAAMPPRDGAGRTVWATRQRPKIDRVACPWLIRRFIDPGARFLFVAPSEVKLVAEKFGAEPFDVAGVRFTHRGDGCAFDAMLEEFGLSHPALDAVAAIVRGADTARPELAAEAKGLMAISFGLSRIYRDDLAQVEAGLSVYDALYRWARDARDEVHDWTPEAA
ncbi:MAG: sulfurtransferase/chromate resistance protein [Pseudomonadota bacterium]